MHTRLPLSCPLCRLQSPERTVTVGREDWEAACKPKLGAEGPKPSVFMSAKHQIYSARHHLFASSQVRDGGVGRSLALTPAACPHLMPVLPGRLSPLCRASPPGRALGTQPYTSNSA